MDDMATVIRSNISKDNPYYIPKERYLELKHFCLQYPYWKEQYSRLNPYRCTTIRAITKGSSHSDLVADIAMARDIFFRKMQMVEQAAIEADPDLYRYILLGVTEGRSFNNLVCYEQMPAGKDMYYDRYRKFFYILDKKRD